MHGVGVFTRSIKWSQILVCYDVIVIVIVIFIWWSPFIPSRNLDEVFTYNHIWLKCPFEADLMLRHPWF